MARRPWLRVVRPSVEFDLALLIVGTGLVLLPAFFLFCGIARNHAAQAGTTTDWTGHSRTRCRGARACCSGAPVHRLRHAQRTVERTARGLVTPPIQPRRVELCSASRCAARAFGREGNFCPPCAQVEKEQSSVLYYE